MVGRNSSDLPPGFRFHPTDEELIMSYLRYQAASRPCPASIIPEVDVYKFDPWELPEKAEFGENEWYFFTPRDRKYPNGVRPNRAAVSGYWKATGTDKAIYSGSKYVGVKKALVFYKGRPPKGLKTDWIMHEYRLSDSRSNATKKNGSMRLDDWVLCRIYKKKNLARTPEQKVEDSFAQIVAPSDAIEPQAYIFPRACSLTHLWEFDYMASISQLLEENAYNASFNNQETISNNGTRGAEKYQPGQVQLQHTDPMYELLTFITALFCMLFSWILIHRLKQTNAKGPKTWPFLGASIEQLMNYNTMHDWLVKYLSQSSTVVVPMPFTTYTYVADPVNVEHVLG